MWRLAAMFALTGGMAAAEGGFQPLTGAEIRAVLTDVVLVYDRGWQDFRASGRTLYHVGGDSWGIGTSRAISIADSGRHRTIGSVVTRRAMAMCCGSSVRAAG